MKIREIKQRIKNTLEALGNWDEKKISTYKTITFFVIGIGLVGIYYYLSLKQLGMAIMIVSLMFLGFLLYIDSKLPPEKQNKRRKQKKMTENDNKMEDIFEEAPKEEKEEGLSFGFETGLPNSEDYNKRMDTAFGSL